MDDNVVMENPYLQSRRDGGSRAAGHSPNHAALATRKTCQNHEFADSFAPLTTLGAGHICPQRCSGYRVISLALSAVEPRIAEFPLIWRTLPDRGWRCGASR
jgi:hypothetical protein